MAHEAFGACAVIEAGCAEALHFTFAFAFPFPFIPRAAWTRGSGTDPKDAHDEDDDEVSDVSPHKGRCDLHPFWADHRRL